MPRRDFTKVPFAATGDVTSIPTEVQPDGSVSMAAGYGFDYQRDNGAGGGTPDPLAKSIPRDATNGILNEITASIGEIQLNGLAIWAASAAPYPINATVRHNNTNWRSTVENNSAQPGVAPLANWIDTTVQIAQATESVAGVMKIATQDLTNTGTDDAAAVTPKKLSAATQGQKHTAFTTTGTATAQILTPAPPITAYAATQRFNVTFNIDSGANPTINVSGQGAKFLKQYDSAGAKVAAVFAANQLGDIEYDGADFVLLDQLPASGLLINTKVITVSGTYTKTPGTNKIKVRQVGGGGAGASVPTSGAGICASGSGGASGSEAEAVFVSGFDSVVVTIGVGGSPVAGTAGGSGGTTRFGALVISPGGGGGNVIQASNGSPFVVPQGAPGSNSTSSGAVSITAKTGQPGPSGIALGAVSLSGQGAASTYGSGGLNSGSGSGTAATGYGAGGGGAANQASGAAFLGGVGTQGVVIVEEYA